MFMSALVAILILMQPGDLPRDPGNTPYEPVPDPQGRYMSQLAFERDVQLFMDRLLYWTPTRRRL